MSESPAVQYTAREILAWCLILLGAAFLAKSVVAKGQKWTMRELLGLRVDKLKVFRNVIEQRLEAGFGFLFVLIGVGIHVYVLLRKSIDAKNAGQAIGDMTKYIGGTVAAMVLLFVLFHYVCKYVSRKSFLEMLAYMVVRYRYHIEDDQELLKQIGEMLAVPHHDDDTVESYTERVEAALKLDKVRERLAKRATPGVPSEPGRVGEPEPPDRQA